MRKELYKILIATGGTGGHIMPAFALSEYINNNNLYKPIITVDIRGYNFCQQNGLSKVEIVLINSKSINKKNLLSKLLALGSISLGILKSLYVFFRLSPKVVIGFGGYPTIPVLIVAIIFRVPIIIHEQNALVGKANILFARFSRYLAISFSDTKYNNKNINEYKFLHDKIKLTGLPLRTLHSRDKNYEKNLKRKFLILGGSLGAGIFSEIIPETFALLSKEEQLNIKVYHQCKEENIGVTKSLWDKTFIEYEIASFFPNVLNYIKESDMVISRAGASTIFEIQSNNKYALYIPLKNSADNHQYYNALNAIGNSNSDILLEEEFTREKLLCYIRKGLSCILEGSRGNYKEENPFCINANKKIHELIVEILS